MSPPRFEVEPGRVTVEVPRNALLSPDTIDWIGSLGYADLSDAQHLALAMMRNSGGATAAMLRVWGVAAAEAGSALRDLVGRGVAERSGGRRYAVYHLAVGAQNTVGQPALVGPTGGSGDTTDQWAVLEAIRAGHHTTAQIRQQLGLSYPTTIRRVNALIEQGLIQPTRPRNSSRQSYRLTNPQEQP